MTRSLPLVPFGATGIEVSALGMGCSHIASLSTRASGREIDRLLDIAWKGGIRLFDTADIYGQGDSERRLARIAARPGAVVVTKAGLELKAAQSLIRLAKPLLRPILARRSGLRNAAAEARQASETHDLDPTRLVARLERSLKRLGRAEVDVFLLHSPPQAALADHQLFEVLHKIKQRGLARGVGVSCQSTQDARWVLDQDTVDAVQIPLQADDLEPQTGLLDLAQAKGVGVIAREVLGGKDAAHALPPLLKDPRISTALVGTTNPAHLRQNLEIAEAAL